MIILLRHAEGTGQAADAPLASEGHAMAQAIVPRLQALGITAVWSSPYLRARQTVDPFAVEAGLRVHEDPRLAERHHGAVPEGAWAEEARQLFADPQARPWGGESREDVTLRARQVIDEISDACLRPLIGCHGFWLSCLLAAYGAPATEAAWRGIPRPALYVVDKGIRQIDLT